MGSRSQFRNVTSTLPQGDKMCRENQLLACRNSYSSNFFINVLRVFLVQRLFVKLCALKKKKKKPQKFDSSPQLTAAHGWLITQLTDQTRASACSRGGAFVRDCRLHIGIWRRSTGGAQVNTSGSH